MPRVNYQPMYFRGITNPIPTSFESDGITFSVHSTYYTNIPENFLHAGEKLSVPEDEALAEWICGPIAPLGNNKFQIALDRTWTNSPICIALRSRGSKTTRAIAEPGYINLSINTEGKVTLLIPKQSLLAKKKLTPNYHGPVISPQNMMK